MSTSSSYARPCVLWLTWEQGHDPPQSQSTTVHRGHKRERLGPCVCISVREVKKSNSVFFRWSDVTETAEELHHTHNKKQTVILTLALSLKESWKTWKNWDATDLLVF
ncbi:hypothetical protein DPEC_G00270080 [Dallia pectoralis]|uniref:Uncharacterized protein n=1 Tax=Dallia pectoralis TaxID=75939 RepID=A0ACC2FPC1_DALPE|nr:hypothetical protein DPEC_G00270080 [Dallia pectoralis]